MDVVFLTNFYNYHQEAFSCSMDVLTDHHFVFVSTEEMSEERKNLGWKVDCQPDYVKYYYQNEKTIAECQQLIDKVDVVIIGSAPNEIVKKRIRSGKLVFRYSERPFKKKPKMIKCFGRVVVWHRIFPITKKVYLLAASAFASMDFKKHFLFINRSYKWGYFPALKEYASIDNLIADKQKNTILWCGRMVDFKHPDEAIAAAKKIKDSGRSFHMNIVGCGEMEDELRNVVKTNSLEDCVHFCGSMPPEEVRMLMDRSEIFIFTSDRNEGWGVVLNEAMNSGCAVVASHASGATPFLVKDRKNGLVYNSCDTDMLYKKIVSLMDDGGLRISLAKNAYLTIAKEWNAEVAAERLIILSRALLNSSKKFDLFQDGPCSYADPVKDDWYKG